MNDPRRGPWPEPASGVVPVLDGHADAETTKRQVRLAVDVMALAQIKEIAGELHRHSADVEVLLKQGMDDRARLRAVRRHHAEVLEKTETLLARVEALLDHHANTQPESVGELRILLARLRALVVEGAQCGEDIDKVLASP